MSEILCRVLIEVLGKPKDHVEKTIKDYVEKIKADERYNIVKEEFAEIKKQENDLWAIFTELEIEMKDLQDLTSFCFDYMPSVLEILKPSKLEIGEKHLSDFFNDLQARLHQVDMIAKQMKLENTHLKSNMGKLLKNYLIVLLGKGDLTLEQLSKFTGINEDNLGDSMDKLLDEGLVKMEKGVYSLNREKLKDGQ